MPLPSPNTDISNKCFKMNEMKYKTFGRVCSTHGRKECVQDIAEKPE
jgi:hypothetical protein